MDGERIIAIDQGTSSIKVVAFDLTGRPIRSASGATPVRVAGGSTMEARPGEWWRQLVRCLRWVLEDSGVPAGSVKALSLCGLLHTLVPLDARCRPMGPVPLWADQRWELEGDPTVRDAAELISELSSRSCVGRLGWLLQTRPEIRSRLHLLLPVKDFLRYMLTGVAATDVHEAACTGLSTIGTHQWSAEVVERLGLTPSVLPPILAPTSPAGSVSPQASEITGLRAGTPVVVGTGDWQAALLGSCATLPERASLYLGTAGVLGGFSSQEDLDRVDGVRCIAAVSSTGSAVDWLARLLLPARRDRHGTAIDEVARLATGSSPGAMGLVFLPHLFGERGGHLRPAATGTLAGFRLSHGRSDVARAVLEGTAIWLRSVAAPSLAAEPVDSLIVSGGGARDPLNSVIAAAIYAKPVLIPEVVEAGALGCAVLAAIGTGLAHGCANTASAWVRIRAVQEPEPDLVAIYREVCERFSRTEQLMRSLERPTPDRPTQHRSRTASPAVRKL
jgi:xylulokinase